MEYKLQELSFACVFAFIFVLLDYLGLGASDGRPLLIVAMILLIIGAVIPKLLHWPNFVWMKFAYYLGVFMTPLMMSFIFLVMFVPIGAFLRLFGKQLLFLKSAKTQKTYWVSKLDTPSTMKNQF